jgi:hypothetical protein
MNLKLENGAKGFNEGSKEDVARKNLKTLATLSL